MPRLLPGQPSPAHLKCYKCKEWKLRRHFYPNLGEEVKIRDKLCSVCRQHIHKTATSNVVLWNRVQAGVMTAEKYEQIIAEKRANRVAAVVAGRRKQREREKMATWEEAHKSAYKARAVLRAFQPLNEDEAAWVEQARELITAALEEIKVRKRQQKLPEEGIHFWYDGLTNGHHAMRRLINQFPRGAEHAPLQVL